MRLFAELRVLGSFDLGQLQKFVDQRVTFDDTNATTASTNQQGLVNLAPSASGVQFSFGDVTNADTVLIVAFQEITAQLNSNSAPAINITPVPANPAAQITSTFQTQPQPGIFLLRGKLTSLYLGNPSSSTPAQAYVAIVGEYA